MSTSRQVFPCDFDKRIRLMGHHHLCMMGYEKLKDEEMFQTVFAPLVEKIRMDPDVLVESIFGYDVFCYDCPHWSDEEGRCETGWRDKISKDAAVLKLLGIDVGSQQTLSKLQELLARNISMSKFAELCGEGEWECEWYPMDHCVNGLKELKQRLGLPEDE